MATYPSSTEPVTFAIWSEYPSEKMPSLSRLTWARFETDCS